jgi:hypothetical protein
MLSLICYRSIASLQGRPLGIRDETFDLQLPTLADIQVDTESINNHMFSPAVSPVNGAAFAIHRFKLDPIISEIKLLFYHLPSRVSAYVWPSDEQSSQVIIGKKLEEWLDTLNQITGSTQDDDDEQLEHHKYKLKLTSQYYAAMILLHQPSQAIPQPTEQSLLICYECATKRLNTYNDLYQTDSFFQSWRSVQGIFSSGATMIYCLWTSNLVRRTIPTPAAMRDLRTCTNLLSVGGELWPSVKKGKESFSRAMDALARKLDQLHHERYQHHDTSIGPQPKVGRSDDGRAVRQNQHVFHSPEGLASEPYSHAITQGQNGPEDFHQATFDMRHSDWTAFSDHTFTHDASASSNAMFSAMQEAPDATVEAFLAEFLNNDTTWNPF